MKHIKKLLAMLMVLVVCTVLAACSSTAGNAGGESTQSETIEEPVTEPATEPVTEDAASAPAEDTATKPNIGIIAWNTGRAVETDFIDAVQASLSEQYADQIGEILVMDVLMQPAILTARLEEVDRFWEGEKAVILFVSEENGFSDEDLLSALEHLEQAGITAGVDHAIDGAPESTFVYDASDPAGCAAMIMEQEIWSETN